ncbi:transcription-repair coupling factor [Hugonella massiliensis]|uniref:transcription-repair coupling factor n=1 Tax=Hugonella massiliensis TaxID=1720315 RepID=UPI00073EA9B4|nr:transcription-repair coupling factor [Hugonella massiliensis]
MLIDALVYPLDRCEDVKAFWAKLDAGADATMGLASSARPFFTAARFARTPQPTLVVVAGEEAANDFARNVGAYIGDDKVLRFFERTDYPFTAAAPDAHAAACRMEALHALASGRECVVVASARSLVRMLPPADAKAYLPLDFAAGREVGDSARADLTDFDSIARALQNAGYENTGELEGPGTFCVRGGAVDVYPGNLSYPVRIDCFGDEVDEIRRIVPSTGQTIANLDAVTIYPVREFASSAKGLARAKKALYKPAQSNAVMREILDKLEGGVFDTQTDAVLPLLFDRTVTLGAYLGPECLTVMIEPRSLIDDALHAYDDIAGRASGSSITIDGLYCPAAQLDFGKNQRCVYQSIMRVGAAVDAEIPVKRTDVAGNGDKLFGKLTSLAQANYTVVFSAANNRAREDMKLAFVEHGLPIEEVLDVRGDDPKKLHRGIVNVVDVDIPLGLIIPKAKLALVSIADTQGAGALRRHKHVDITQVTFPFKPGDYVVHASHGIAYFKELVQQEINGVVRDYLLLQYADDDKLFVPVEQLDRVTRYVGPEGSSPRLTRLNTSDWSRAMNKARKASKKLAFDLVDVYTRRAASKGFRYSPDTPWMRQMEEDFPYQETPDQLAAIADVKADMQSSRPMDRLICGDVGFGKTEVALRAAFKATQDKKQVMVLCPTTILAQQHYANFKDRFDPYGVEVEVLSRFRTPAQQKHALAGFADGTVQVLVGTHRLLSRDVNSHDLGLVIIDEEQRFGVQAKEQMKNLRESIDVLTLSATPIPRTMQMSLSGVRDMSLILTPPDDRLPVEVHVGEWDPDVVSDAIRHELARHGQVYYVSNRVHDIDDAVQRVQEAAPEARIGIAHGKMSKEELEGVMEEFAAGTVDVLVATTIIESGIDNPHSNTLIIEDAHRLGLAQMYQLKGRVGRSNRQAYAYFMFPENVPLTEEATSRLEAINEYQDLGSGMRVAMRDLEIRGAGSMLGAEQSGNLSQVGFDLFAQMLQEAVTATREGTAEGNDFLPDALSDITVNVPASTYLPEEYIPDADERVLIYRKVAFAEEVEDVDALASEVEAAHPGMPAAAANFFERARVRALAHAMHVHTVSVVAGKLNIEPVAAPTGDVAARLRRAKARYVKQTRKLQVPLKFFDLGEDDSLLEAVYALLRDLKG